MSDLIIKKNRTLLDTVLEKTDTTFAEKQSNDRKVEIIGLKEKIQQNAMELEDSKDKYRSIKLRCLELEKLAQERQERSNYWQGLCEQAKKAGADSNNQSVAIGDKAKYE